jgi:predicted nucleotidyltransferase
MSAPRALLGIVQALRARKRDFAVVGGLAVSARTEPRFTRDVDVAVTVANDDDAEALIRDLRASGYRVVATVEHETRRRLSTARLSSPEKVTVDLLFASCGIESPRS